MTEKRIVWEKWHDPFLARKKKATQEELEEDDDLECRAAKDTFRDEDEDDEYVEELEEQRTGPGIITPFGIIPLHEHNSPSRIFNFWSGHANFDITPAVRDAIEAVAGVETLDIFSRYRFRVGVGKLFDREEVFKAIENTVCQKTPDPTPTPAPTPVEKIDPTQQRIELVKKQLAAKHKHWAILLLENGKLHLAYGDDFEVVKADAESRMGQAKQVVASWNGGANAEA